MFILSLQYYLMVKEALGPHHSVFIFHDLYTIWCLLPPLLLYSCREAARECRRKKKEYVRCLENRVAILESQNQALIGELRALKELYLPKSDA